MSLSNSRNERPTSKEGVEGTGEDGEGREGYGREGGREERGRQPGREGRGGLALSEQGRQ